MTHTTVSFERACALLDKALSGTLRRDVVAGAASARTLGKALGRLREGMRSHAWGSGPRHITLDRIVRDYDRRTRAEGLHALHDWDGKADRVNDDSIPVDVLNFVIAQRGEEPVDPAVLAILLDYYFLYVLALLSLRIWDRGDADENLDRLEHLIERLQGPGGSGQRFAADAATLILIATSHYEREERGYGLLLERARRLGRAHRTKIALGHAVCVGCHLRFGFEVTYGRDTVVMRNDNVADYPWLCFSLATLLREYARLREHGIEGVERDTIVEAILNGLSADARAFVGAPPPSLSACEAERVELRDTFLRYREALVEAFARYRPSEQAYSPLSFFFNFSHNVLKGTVVDALLRGRPWRLALNDLLTSAPLAEEGGDSQEALATTLMGYARAAPDTIRGRLVPVVVYDPQAGRQAFGITMRKLRE
ncbi:MAG: hypothetical protein ACRD26_13840 [Vicinamibacterales bacterium]